MRWSRSFRSIARTVDARLLLVGDGPELGTVYRVGRELGVLDRRVSTRLGHRRPSSLCCRRRTCSCCRQHRKASVWLRSRRWRAKCRSWRHGVGGLPEVIDHGVTGFLHPPAELWTHSLPAPSACSPTFQPAPAHCCRRPRQRLRGGSASRIGSCRCTRIVTRECCRHP